MFHSLIFIFLLLSTGTDRTRLIKSIIEHWIGCLEVLVYSFSVVYFFSWFTFAEFGLHLRSNLHNLWYKLAKMATLSHQDSRRMYSWWWNSHISPKNSRWLQENLTGTAVFFLCCGNRILLMLELSKEKFPLLWGGH